jgi:integrase
MSRSPLRSRTILGTVPRRLDTPYVLVNPDTGTRYVNMVKGLEAARRRSSTAALCWHDLRRTAGCRWLQRDGRQMAEVSMLLGHSSVAVTEQRYAFLDARPWRNRWAAAQIPAQGRRTTMRNERQYNDLPERRDDL